MEVDMEIDLSLEDEGDDGKNRDPDRKSSADASPISHEALVPHKIHFKGLDEFSTDDIRTFASELSPNIFFDRVEWIDDTSANLVYSDQKIASEAYKSFLLGTVESSQAEMQKVALTVSHPQADLRMRIAFTTDKKRPRAYEASRYYLMHPEQDPREQPRSSRFPAKPHLKRSGAHEPGRGKRKRDGFDHFDVSMYDDFDTTESRPRDEVESTKAPSRRRLARRSESPVDKHDRASNRYRSRRDLEEVRHEDRLLSNTNQRKELFPHKVRPSSSEDLFSNKLLVPGIKKTIYPTGAGTINHRRSLAFDAADETADLFAGKMIVAARGKPAASKSLAERIGGRL